MVVLKKVKGSTLIETLVASVIIVIVFTIASLTLSNIFRSTIVGNTDAIENKLNKVAYLYKSNKISTSYNEQFQDWEIKIISDKKSVRLVADHLQRDKEIIRIIAYVSQK
jgi:ribosomal protein L30/L7E